MYVALIPQIHGSLEPESEAVRILRELVGQQQAMEIGILDQGTEKGIQETPVHIGIIPVLHQIRIEIDATKNATIRE